MTDQIESLARRFTSVMIFLVIPGNLFPGPEISGYSIYPYRLLIPLYGVFLILYIFYSSRLFISRSMLILLSFIVLFVWSASWAWDPNIAAEQSLHLLSLALLTIGITITISDRKTAHRYLLIVTLLGVLAIFISAWEVSIGTPLPTSKLEQPVKQGIFVKYTSAWYYNINNLTFFLVLATVYPLAIAIFGGYSKWLRAISGALWLSGLLIIVNLFARASLLATLMTISTLLIIYLVRKGWLPMPAAIYYHISRIIVFFGGIFLILIFLFIENPFPPEMGSIHTRWNIQEAATIIALNHPLGVGSGNSVIAIGTLVQTSGAPHAWYAHVLADYGFLGLILYLLFLGNLIGNAILNAFDSLDPLTIGLTAWCLALPISMLGPSYAINLPTFWIGIGITMGLAKLR